MSATSTVVKHAGPSTTAPSTARIMLATPPRKASAPSSSKKLIYTWTFCAAAIAPAFARDVHRMRADFAGDPKNVFFWLGTVPCRTVTLVGIVVDSWQRENMLGFALDDGTGLVECVQKFGYAKLSGPALGDIVRATGHIYIRRRRDAEERQLDLDRDGFKVERASAEPRHAILVAELHRTRYVEPFAIDKDDITATPRAARVVSTQQQHPPTQSESQVQVQMSPVRLSQDVRPALPPTTTTAAAPTSPTKPATLTHPANLRTKQRTRNTFRIYLKHYLSSDPTREGGVFGLPKLTASGNSSGRVGDDSVLTSVPSQFVEYSQEREQGVGQRSVFTTPTKRRRISSPKEKAHPTSSEAVGFTRKFLESVPELSALATAVARVERHMRDKPPTTTAPTTKTKTADRPRTRDEKESADAEAGREVLRWALRTLCDEGALVIHEGLMWAWSHAEGALVVQESEDEGYAAVTSSLLEQPLKRLLARAAGGKLTAELATERLRRTDDRWRKVLVLDVRDALESIGALAERT